MVKAVNIGRRPIILTSLVVQYDDGSTRGIPLGHYPDGLTLKEQEHYERTFEDGDNNLHCPEEGSSAYDFWFINTQGKKLRVAGSKELIKKVWEK